MKSSFMFGCLIRATSSSRRRSGIAGVNLIYGAFFLTKNSGPSLVPLLDDLAPGRIEIDMIRFSGPDFADVDDRIMALCS